MSSDNPDTHLTLGDWHCRFRIDLTLAFGFLRLSFGSLRPEMHRQIRRGAAGCRPSQPCLHSSWWRSPARMCSLGRQRMQLDGVPESRTGWKKSASCRQSTCLAGRRSTTRPKHYFLPHRLPDRPPALNLSKYNSSRCWREVIALGPAFSCLDIALRSANNGINAIFDAMNVACEESDKRGFQRNLASIAHRPDPARGCCGMLSLLHLQGWAEALIAAGCCPLLIVTVCSHNADYRFGPSRWPASGTA